jgi:plasmid maintenance system antidote protein VapI
VIRSFRDKEAEKVFQRRFSAKLWLNLQVPYDLDTEEDRLGGRIEEEVKPMRGVA